MFRAKQLGYGRAVKKREEWSGFLGHSACGNGRKDMFEKPPLPVSFSYTSPHLSDTNPTCRSSLERRNPIAGSAVRFPESDAQIWTRDQSDLLVQQK